MSRHCEKCCDILSDVHVYLCRDNEKNSLRQKLSFQSLSLKLIISRHKNFAAQVNICCDIQNIVATMFFLL